MDKDIKRIRELAKQWDELLHSEEQEEKRKAWTRLHDLKP